ncbi:MAG: uracil-DNA glycosylase family protein, partial [Burkholderiaceae bacterium]
AWRAALLAQLPHIGLTVLLGRHAIGYHLPEARGRALADILQGWLQEPTSVVPLPHPSPRNMAWMKHHPWFEAEVLPALRAQVTRLMA